MMIQKVQEIETATPSTLQKFELFTTGTVLSTRGKDALGVLRLGNIHRRINFEEALRAERDL